MGWGVPNFIQAVKETETQSLLERNGNQKPWALKLYVVRVLAGAGPLINFYRSFSSLLIN
jgi:hypothetical protein